VSTDPARPAQPAAGTQTTSPRLVDGRYALEEMLGHGGMGTVWRARDELLLRSVAIKEVLPPEGLSSEERLAVRERTLREARATARLSHPGIVRVYDVVEDDDRPWIVMELLDARSLAEVIRAEGPLSPAQTAAVGVQVLDALVTAHRGGVLHRDVKPGNVLLESPGPPEGRVILTDFGIATSPDETAMTTTGLLVGSPAYIAPERARGNSLGPQSDLWSLGATLYTAVEGRPPFDKGAALATLAAVVEEPPQPYVAAGPLRPLLDGLLEKDPVRRLDAAEARRQLTELATGASPGPVPDGLDERTTVLSLPTAPSRTQTLPAYPGPPPPQGPGPGSGQGSARPPSGPAPGSGRPAGRPAPPPSPRGQRPPPPRGQRRGGAPAPAAPRGYAREPRRSRGGRVVVALLALVLLALGGVYAGTQLWGGLGGSGSGSGSGGGSGSGSGGPGGASGEPSTEVPDGFRRYTDDRGFSVAVPKGWRRVQEGDVVDFRSNDGTRLLRFDRRAAAGASAAATWKAAEPTVEQRLEGYERVRIEPVKYRGYDAADWEFTFTGDGGPRRVLDRGFVVDDVGYAIYLSVPAERFEEDRHIFETATETFALR